MAFRGDTSRSTQPRSPATSLEGSVGDIATALANNDLRALERQHAAYHHRILPRLIFHAAAQDPRCSPVGALPAAVLVVIGFLISGLWQVAAVYLAARYELGLSGTSVMVSVGIAVAVLVVSLDWDIVHHRVRGETRFSMLAIRLVFVTVMALLVSEAVAGWVFDKDIKQQVQAANDVRLRQYADLRARDNPKLDALNARLGTLNQAVIDAEARVAAANREMQRQSAGLLGARAGQGKLYATAKLEHDTAMGARNRANQKLRTDGAALRDQRQRILDTRKAFETANPRLDPSALGPGQRGRALWTYLLANPDALWLRRVPLALVMIVLDLFAVIVSWGIGKRVRQRHTAWAAELDALHLRLQRIQRSLQEAGEERVSLLLSEWESGGHLATDIRSAADRSGAASVAGSTPMTLAGENGRGRSRESSPDAFGIPRVAPSVPFGDTFDTLPVVGAETIDLRTEDGRRRPDREAVGLPVDQTATVSWPTPFRRNGSGGEEAAWDQLPVVDGRYEGDRSGDDGRSVGR